MCGLVENYTNLKWSVQSKIMKTNQRKKEVGEFIKNIEHPLKKGMVLLREIILSADKGITENIKWSAPSFCYNNDDRITMNSEARIVKDNYLSLMFHRGAKKKDTKGFKFTDDEGLFVWVTPDRALIKFKTVKDIETKKSALKKIVKKWMLATK